MTLQKWGSGIWEWISKTEGVGELEEDIGGLQPSRLIVTLIITCHSNSRSSRNSGRVSWKVSPGSEPLRYPYCCSDVEQVICFIPGFLIS